MRTPMDEHLEFTMPSTNSDLMELFARYILHYFRPWNPADDTWVDADNNSYYTKDLVNLFQEYILNNESNT